MTDTNEDRLDKSTELSAQVWCKESCKDIEMDSRLATEFANTLRPYIEEVERLRKERDNAIIIAKDECKQKEKLEAENARHLKTINTLASQNTELKAENVGLRRKCGSN